MSRRRSRFTTATTTADLRTMLLAQPDPTDLTECGYVLGRGKVCHGLIGRPYTHATRCPGFRCESDERGE